MNKQHVLILLLAIALLVTTFKNQNDDPKDDGNINISKKEALFSVIFNRKSVRKFTNQKVSMEQLDTIMKAGMAAPSGHDARPWQFVAITDRNVMLKLRKNLKWARGLDESTAAIVVCGDMNKIDPRNPEFWITDTSAATQNMLLAIEAMGLGGVWSTLYPGPERMEYARQVLGLPSYIMPLCVIPIGYPTGVEKPKDKYDKNNIHWESW